MEEICNCAKGLGTAAEALFFAITIQAVGAAMFLLAATLLV